ncbi:MAG: hypothetical protein PHF64_00420 [Methanoregula sp.]|nr:hypothetical protein [Methanoregula sp.]
MASVARRPLDHPISTADDTMSLVADPRARHSVAVPASAIEASRIIAL